MDYLIRKATIEDLVYIVDLWEKLSISQLTKDKYYKGDFDFNGGFFQFKNAIENEACCIFVAELKGKVVGFIEVWLYNKDFHFFIDDYAYILHFYVDVSARNDKNILGIIYRLFIAAQDWAKEQGRKYLVADVFSHNTRVMKLLERVGLSSYRVRYVKELDI